MGEEAQAQVAHPYNRISFRTHEPNDAGAFLCKLNAAQPHGAASWRVLVAAKHRASTRLRRSLVEAHRTRPRSSWLLRERWERPRSAVLAHTCGGSDK